MMNRRGKNGAEDPKVKVPSLIRRGNDLAAACRRDRAELVQDLNDRNGGKTPLDPGLGAEALERSRKLSRMDIQTTLERGSVEGLQIPAQRTLPPDVLPHKNRLRLRKTGFQRRSPETELFLREPSYRVKILIVR